MGARYDLEADVVVVGGGAAGACAAAAAADLGASVIVLEKPPRTAHRPAALMGGGIAMGIDDIDQAVRYLDRCSGGMIPAAVNRTWADRALGLQEWLAGAGSGLSLERRERSSTGAACNPAYEGAESLYTFNPVDVDLDPAVVAMGEGAEPGSALDMAALHDERRGGARLLVIGLLNMLATRPRVSIRWNSPGRRLIREVDGRIAGVEAGAGGDRVRIGASAGVILASGGFGMDEDLKLHWLRANPVYFAGSPYATGDGIRMALEMGAATWHVQQLVGRTVLRLPDGRGGQIASQAFLDFPGLGPDLRPGYLVTDRDGRRFSNEAPYWVELTSTYYELYQYSHAGREYARIPCFWFFDERRIRAGPMMPATGGPSAAGLLTWSADNRSEIGLGLIPSGDSVEEVAERAGVRDPALAAATLRAYNEACRLGRDEEFGRPAATLNPIQGPPYYCLPMYPGGAYTCGGPRRDERGRILDPWGQPIPGLYGAGELACAAVGHVLTSPGAGLSDAFCGGRLAAETAAGARARLD